MAWEEELFAYLDDLEGQAAALYDAERAEELSDRSRAEYREVTLAARLMASVGSEVTLELIGIGPVSGRLERVATGWVLLRRPGQDWVVVLAAVGTVAGAVERAVPEVAWSPLTRLGLGSVLRRIADHGDPCTVHVLDGARHEGVVLRVGADFVELSEGEVGRVVLVSFGQLAAVQSTS